MPHANGAGRQGKHPGQKEGLPLRAALPLSGRGPAPGGREFGAPGCVTVTLRHAASTSVEVTIQLRDAGDRGDRQ
jgi:hypothetical protein